MKNRPGFVCQECGAWHAKWTGQCSSCGAWNSVVEEARSQSGPPGRSISASRGQTVEIETLAGGAPAPSRRVSGIGELDRVLGGGLVTASAVLIGGDPGIGKSTLLLEAACRYADAGASALYVAGEEASEQVRMRAQRLGLSGASLQLATATNLRDILATLEAGRPDLVVIDSIQTLWADTVDRAPGSVAQFRTPCHELVHFAKRRGSAVILVGHVTKEGQLAGPRVVEHMVDTVLYFEGERTNQYRILRTVKNRFGPTHEIGVFEMTGRGLAEVRNPSRLFLGENEHPSPGTAVFASLEGSRPLLLELQSLVAPTALGTARRAVVGWDPGRLAMVLAVLEARCGIRFIDRDVYLNVAGGMRVNDPAADLAVVAALVSSRQEAPLPAGSVYFGELSLSGALRPASHAETRLREAAKLGYTKAVVPTATSVPHIDGLSLHKVADLAAFIEKCSRDFDQ